MGIEAKKYLDAGNLVPSEITVDMVRARLAEPDAVKGFLLDGFPRSTGQADALVEILTNLDETLNGVLSLEVDADVVVERMLARGRADDTEEVIRNRLSVYATETAPLLEYYAGHIMAINAVGDVQEVHQRILGALGDN